MKKTPDLTKPEYDILRVLWKQGEMSVREVHGILRDSQGWALTTVRTMMDRMTRKRLLSKTDSHGVFVYRPMISRPEGLTKMIRFFADRVLETDAQTVVSMFSNTKGLTEQEIRELRKLLDEENPS
jgi:BlaI family transcriptional regulator, penicillinase repressor